MFRPLHSEEMGGVSRLEFSSKKFSFDELAIFREIDTFILGIRISLLLNSEKNKTLLEECQLVLSLLMVRVYFYSGTSDMFANPFFLSAIKLNNFYIQERHLFPLDGPKTLMDKVFI